jgi:hypothetical protein
MENFKDGNILGGKFLKAEGIYIVTEQEFAQITNSGGTLEILDTLVPNPKKELPEVVEAKALQAEAEVEEELAKEAEVAQAKEKTFRASDEQPKRKAGRPKKNAS